MATASTLISIARGEIGVKESPSGSNKQKYGVWYGMNGEPWCDMFVSWVAAQAGQTDIGKYAYCPYHVTHFKNKGLWLGRTTDTRPGDIVFFAGKDGVACHIGIVEAKIDNATVQTIEGNTSVTSNDNGGAVMRRTRSYGTVGSTWYILGFARPVYEESLTGKWIKNNVGWWYQYSNGTWPYSCWKKLNNKWYWFDKNGYAVTGWHKIDGKWYYFKNSSEGEECAMAENGFRIIGGKWYGFAKSGALMYGPIQTTGDGDIIIP